MLSSISIPEKKASAWTAETTVASTHDWLGRLPVGDSLESARDLYQALYTLNRMALAPKLRMELMEVYRVPVSQVAGQLHNRLSHAPYPLSSQRFRLAESIRDLYVEMAYGYKLTLSDLESVKIPVWGKSSVRSQAIFRSIHYLGNIVLRSIYNYLAYPKGVWKEIHFLYRYAESIKCLAEPVVEFKGEEKRTSTIEKRYKEILLLGLSDPYHIPQGQCGQINNFVYRWAELATIRNSSENQPLKDGVYLIFLDQDSPGTRIEQDRDYSVEARMNIRLLDVAPLVDSVASMIRRIETGTPVSELDLGSECLADACMDMLKRLKYSWGGTRKRQSTRLGMSGSVSVCSGINAIHYFLTKSQGSNFTADFGNGADTMRSPVLLSGKGMVRESNPDRDAASFGIANWEVVDASGGGALIRGKENNGPGVRIGDLVALMDSGTKSPFKLFVVRWMKEQGLQGLEVGLELMSSSITPILVGEEHGAGGFVPGLMLDKVATGPRKLPRTLVLKKNVRGKQKDIELIEKSDTRSKWVRVLEVVDKTNTYERVSFASLTSDSR